MDPSHGYEAVAAAFIRWRGRDRAGVGAATVRAWARALPPGATVLDLGCGTGLRISGVLLGAGLAVYGVDASPTLVAAFHHNFPATPVACEAVEDSVLFGRTFDAVVAWGLLFLLPPDVQVVVVEKMARALRPGGGSCSPPRPGRSRGRT